MPRVKDTESGHKHSNFSNFENGLTSNLVSFNRELIEYFPELIYTSGKRSPEDKIGTHYLTSKHNTGNAVDFEADKKVYEFLTKDVRGLRMLNKYGLGILDETTPKAMKDNGATGRHYHVGIDPGLVAQNKRYLASMEKSGNYYQIEGIKDPERKSEIDNVTHETKLPDYMYSYNTTPMQTPTGETIPMPDIADDIETEEIAKDKEDNSESRQRLTAVENTKNTIEEMGLFSYLTDSEPNQDSNSEVFQYKPLDIPDTPQLQGLNSIFQLRRGGTFSKKGYKNDSPDKNNAFNVIDSNNITMQNVDHPVVGIDDTGHIKIMMPDEEYTFPGNRVLEIPVKNL